MVIGQNCWVLSLWMTPFVGTILNVIQSVIASSVWPIPGWGAHAGWTHAWWTPEVGGTPLCEISFPEEPPTGVPLLGFPCCRARLIQQLGTYPGSSALDFFRRYSDTKGGISTGARQERILKVPADLPMLGNPPCPAWFPSRDSL